ncbi:MAG: glycosyltransferase family 4 protein [Tepidisphaeraceae bacterium]
MKIALVILHADPARGGAERYTADLAVVLGARGNEVSVLASDFGAEIAGVQFVSLNSRSVTRRGRYAALLDSLDGHLAEHRYDIVHAMLPVRKCDVYHPHAGLAAAAVVEGHKKHSGRIAQTAARLANRLNRKRLLFASVERALLTGPRPPTVLCLSQYVQRTVAGYYDLPPAQLATLFNAVDLERFDPSKLDRVNARAELSISGDRVVALIAAQDFGRKGLGPAIEGLAAVGDPRLLLLVAGKDDPRRYERLAADLNVRGQVRFLGPVSDMRPLYAAADFFVLPTRHDPCSLVVLESLAMGLPVISTVFNGACEIMETGRHGEVLADPADIPALSAAMRRLLDAPTRAQMREECLALCGRLSFDGHVDRLLAIYNARINAN